LEEGTGALVGLLSEPIKNPQYIIGNPLPFPTRTPPDELNEYRIYRNLKLEENPFLADHVIGGNPVLPTVCAVSWFINSAQALTPGYKYFATTDYQVFKGILFDTESPSEYLLELSEIEKSSEKVRFQGKISSQNADGKTRFHYQAKVELRKTIPAQPQFIDFDLGRTEDITGKSLYESKILFHGPRLQGLEEVLNISPNGITTRCRLKHYPDSDYGQFQIKEFNPYLADVQLQSLLVWSHLMNGKLGLPLKIAGGIQYQQVPMDHDSYVTMQVKETNTHKLVADVISHDLNGMIFSQVRNAEITLNEKLYELFQQNRLEIEPTWM
jgi:hypothetical protein